MVELEADETRKKELETISQICQRVPAEPARSFYEAVQSVWFIHLVIQIESNGHSASLGRLDQYLYDYYKNDMKNKVLSRDFAKELLECLWIKLYSILKIRPTSHSGYGKVPEAVAPLLVQVDTYENIAAEAILHEDDDLLIEALMCHPFINSYDLAQKICMRIVNENKKYMA